MLKIAICEDIPVQLQKIRDMVEALIDLPHEIVTYTSDADFKQAFIYGHASYDMVFMDIDLGSDHDNGIALTARLNEISPHTQIIYVSEHLEYVSSVYETKHVYFLSKSQMEEYLPRAIRAALSNLRQKEHQYLYFKKRKQHYSIPQNDILYMERILRDTQIHTVDGVYATSDNFSVLLEQLSPAFLICHRSFLVNMQAVRSLNRDQIVLRNGKSIPVGRTYYKLLKKAFAKIILEQ